MSIKRVGILNAGLITAVGQTAAASCAAIRAGLSNPSESQFVDSEGGSIMVHSVDLDRPWRGRVKLVKMAAAAINDCLSSVPRLVTSSIPLLLCVAEIERPGRFEGLDDEILSEIQNELQFEFSSDSEIVPYGRISVGLAMRRSREILAARRARHVLIAATDTLLTWPTLHVYDRADRLLTRQNSNGFIAGEGAGALLVGPPEESPLVCSGLGFATEAATVESELPLRGNGLTQAIRTSLTEAECHLSDLDFRITDLGGEHYYFKEAALALGRALRSRKSEFQLWHPAECIGETGATSGLASVSVAFFAFLKRYALGQGVLIHASADPGGRMAMVLRGT